MRQRIHEKLRRKIARDNWGDYTTPHCTVCTGVRSGWTYDRPLIEDHTNGMFWWFVAGYGGGFDSAGLNGRTLGNGIMPVAAAPLAALAVRCLANPACRNAVIAGLGATAEALSNAINGNGNGDDNQPVTRPDTSGTPASPDPNDPDEDPKFGSHKSASQWQAQMQQRGWTKDQIREAIANGQRYNAPNNVNPGNTATRYVHPRTGQSVVVDDQTGEILHVGGPGFLY